MGVKVLNYWDFIFPAWASLWNEKFHWTVFNERWIGLKKTWIEEKLNNVICWGLASLFIDSELAWNSVFIKTLSKNRELGTYC